MNPNNGSNPTREGNKIIDLNDQDLNNQSIANTLSAAVPNLRVPNPGVNMDASLVMNSLFENMRMQTSTYHIPYFNGKTPLLKEFI